MRRLLKVHMARVCPYADECADVTEELTKVVARIQSKGDLLLAGVLHVG